jgi:hypothetical protein
VKIANSMKSWTAILVTLSLMDNGN